MKKVVSVLLLLSLSLKAFAYEEEERPGMAPGDEGTMAPGDFGTMAPGDLGTLGAGEVGTTNLKTVYFKLNKQTGECEVFNSEGRVGLINQLNCN